MSSRVQMFILARAPCSVAAEDLANIWEVLVSARNGLGFGDLVVKFREQADSRCCARARLLVAVTAHCV